MYLEDPVWHGLAQAWKELYESQWRSNSCLVRDSREPMGAMHLEDRIFIFLLNVGAEYELYSTFPIHLHENLKSDRTVPTLHVINDLFIRRRNVSNSLQVTLYNLGSSVVTRTGVHFITYRVILNYYRGFRDL
jgi:hypothetical protein